MVPFKHRFFLSRRPPFLVPDRLGERLCHAGVITRQQLETALERQDAKGRRLGCNLVALGHIDEETLANFLSDHYRTPSVLLHSKAIDDAAAALLDTQYMIEVEAVVLTLGAASATVAMVDPCDRELIGELESKLGLRVNPVVAPQSAIRKAVAQRRVRAALPAKLANEPEAERERVGELFAELNDYDLVGVIGEGGFAKVYKCIQRSLDRPVAVKTLSVSKAPSEEVIQRFEREGRIAARLNHINIVRVIEQGKVGDTLYMVMEFVEGAPIDEQLAGRPFEDKLDAVIQTSDALAYAHGEGVLHRDIKPANILMDQNGLVRLLDFGIALLNQPVNEQRLTHPNIVMGTPRYMAPEQRSNFRDIDERADLYALGVMMLEIFTGQASASPKADPLSLNPELPPPLSEVIKRCLAESPEDRLPSVASLKDSLLQLRDQLLGNDDSLGRSLRHAVAQNRELVVKDRYEFLSELKKNAVCQLTLARHKGLRRMILIRKVQSKEGLEASKILARARHPNIGEILGVAEDADAYLIIGEHLSGGSLADRVKLAASLPGEQALEYALTIAEALAFAQGYKIAHGHLHPNNVMFASDGTLKVVDFSTPNSSDPEMERFYKTASRAHVAQGDLHGRDRFGLGVMMFEMLTGRRYKPAKGPAGNLDDLKRVRVYPLRLHQVVARLWNLTPPNQRYADAGAVVQGLRLLGRQILGKRHFASGSSTLSGTRPVSSVSSTQPRRQLAPAAAIALLTLLAGGIGWGVFWYLRTAP